MAAIDDFKGRSTTGSIGAAAAVTPSDSVDLSNVTRRVYVGVAGHLKVTMKGSGVVVFSNAPVGWHDLRVTRIWATGTTATSLVAAW